MSIGPYILLLPDVAIEKIFSFLTYDEIAKNREVCRKFNEIGSQLLSRGFLHVERRHSAIYKKMKALLPRRESERRTHPLSRHCEILSAVETRLSMLHLAFSKYIESGSCCFIPGKVIDEIETILKVVEIAAPPPRTHEVLQELRDISSMAIEYFEENILPNIKVQVDNTSLISLLQPCVSSNPPNFAYLKCSFVDDLKKIKKQSKIQKAQITQMNTLLEKVNRRVKRQYVTQERKLMEQSIKIQEQESTIADLRKYIDDWEQRFADLTTEVRARDEFLLKPPSRASIHTARTLPPYTSSCNTKCDLSNIINKTLNATIERSGLLDPERKRKCSSPFEIPSKLARGGIIKEQTLNVDCPSVSSLGIVKNDTVGNNKQANETDSRSLISKKAKFGSFLSSSLENIIKNPITNIRSRKRKMPEDIDLAN